MGLRNGLQLLLQFLGACFPMFSTAGQITNRYTQLPNLLLFLGSACFHRSRLARSFLVLRAAFLSSFITPPRHENLSLVGPESSMKYNVRKTHGLDSLPLGAVPPTPRSLPHGRPMPARSVRARPRTRNPVPPGIPPTAGRSGRTPASPISRRRDGDSVKRPSPSSEESSVEKRAVTGCQPVLEGGHF